MARLSLAVQVVLALAGWGAVAAIVTRTYPTQPQALVAFYGALFVALSATAGCLFWLALRALSRKNPPHPTLSYLSHGMVFSALALFGLWLQSLRMLSPLHVVLLFGLFLFFELAVALGGRGT
jgi:hypothetical protein